MLGISITVGSLAMLLSLVSFYPEDLESTGEIHNLIGPVGAYIANKILYVLGLSGFLLPITLVIPGVFHDGSPAKGPPGRCHWVSRLTAVFCDCSTIVVKRLHRPGK